MLNRQVVVAVGALVFVSCGERIPPASRSALEPAARTESGTEAAHMPMDIRSVAFQNNGTIPKKYTCDGDDASPQLTWTGVPEGTKSLALIMDDPDAPSGAWVHWVLYDMPGEAKGLPEGVEKKETLAGGAKQGACWGVESFSRVGYYGPCPPPGKPHRYYFKLYALDTALDLSPKADKAWLLQAMEGHILAQAELVGRYGR
ncbi:MAG: YbhB/YbcL family Raf kinase inhibitor-like protein [Elusimicrobiota bacterium]